MLCPISIIALTQHLHAMYAISTPFYLVCCCTKTLALWLGVCWYLVTMLPFVYIFCCLKLLPIAADGRRIETGDPCLLRIERTFLFHLLSSIPGLIEGDHPVGSDPIICGTYTPAGMTHSRWFRGAVWTSFTSRVITLVSPELKGSIERSLAIHSAGEIGAHL